MNNASGGSRSPSDSEDEARDPRSPVRPATGGLRAPSVCDCHICRPDGPYDDQEVYAISMLVEHGRLVNIVSDEVPCRCCGPEEPAEDESGLPPFH